jgi:hypothetical protein
MIHNTTLRDLSLTRVPASVTRLREIIIAIQHGNLTYCGPIARMLPASIGSGHDCP